MKVLIWIISFLIAAILDTIIKDIGIAYSLAVSICPSDVDGMAILTGLFGGTFTVIIYGLAFYAAKKINENREVAKFHKDVVNSGLSAFEYAKSITPSEVIAFCDQHLDGPVYVVTAKIDQLPDDKIISRPCADVLIEGYTKLMQ